jgi:hypothetical protein
VTLPIARLLLAVLAVVAIVVGIDNMERRSPIPTRADTPRSRARWPTGDWVTPRLNGLKYFEKPPLQYWASALSFRLFGENEYTARLYIVLAGFATIALLGFLGKRLWGWDMAIASMLAIACSPYFMALGGIVTLDMGLTLWTTATLFAFIGAEGARDRPATQLRWMLCAWAGMALAMLSKGLVGIIFAGAAVFIVMVIRRDIKVLNRLHLIPGLAIFFAIAAPWFVAVSMANDEFAQFFFIHEHFARFLTRAHRRVEPWWYFLPIVAAGFLPWMFAMPAAIARHSARRKDAISSRCASRSSAAFVVVLQRLGIETPPTCCRRSAAGTRIRRYLQLAPERRLALWSGLAIPVALALVVVAYRVPESAKDAWTRAMYEEAMPWAVAAALVLLAGAIATALLMLRRKRWPALAAAAFAAILLIDCGEEAYEEITPRQSGIEVAEK